MASWHEQTEQDFRDIERDRDLPPDEPYEFRCEDPEGDWIADMEDEDDAR